MADVDSQFMTERAIEQPLTIILEDGEDILECMKKAALEQDAKEFKIVDINGCWKEGFMNYFLKNQFKSRKTFETEKIIAGSGKFTREGNDYLGDLKIAVAIGNNRINGNLLEGKAAKELTIKLKFPKFLNENTSGNAKNAP